MTEKRKLKKWHKYISEVDEAAKKVSPRLQEHIAKLSDEDLTKALKFAMYLGNLVAMVAIVEEEWKRIREKGND